MSPPWVVRNGGIEIARGGDWSQGGAVRVWASEPCAGAKPHMDANGERDAWRICGRPVERVADTGAPTGRCADCRQREAHRRHERASLEQLEAARPAFSRAGGMR